MIIEVAKAEFLKTHQDRKRSPRGFTDGVQFKLTAIEDGSAGPVISLVVAATTLFAPENQTYFERARDAVVSAIAAAEQNQSITAHLPEKTLGYFDRLGRSLREGEAIEFAREHNAAARLTRETRRRILLASTTVTELTEETSVRGTVPEADQDDMTFEIQLFDGRKIKSPVFPQHLDIILEAFNGYKNGTRILLQGIGRFDRRERLLRFDSIEHASVLDPLERPRPARRVARAEGRMARNRKPRSHRGNLELAERCLQQQLSRRACAPVPVPDTGRRRSGRVAAQRQRD